MREVAALYPDDVPRAGGMRRIDMWQQVTHRYDVKKMVLDGFVGYLAKAREVCGCFCHSLILLVL
jgi:hypothetical protein